ncbi:MAG: nitroreductase family protein [Phycisphaerales bacterium]
MDRLKPEVAARRRANHPIHPLFLNRWSPRAMSGEPISEAELMTLFEAARWAPSSFNAQPWRFVYARRDTAPWARLFDLLVPANQAWCKDAAALLVACSRTTFEHNGKPNPSHAYDTGAAWMSLSLQGEVMGLVVHGMAGFDRERAARDLGVPPGHEVLAMAAIGRPGDPARLPEPVRAKETPSDRKPVSAWIVEGRFA